MACVYFKQAEKNGMLKFGKINLCIQYLFIPSLKSYQRAKSIFIVTKKGWKLNWTIPVSLYDSLGKCLKEIKKGCPRRETAHSSSLYFLTRLFYNYFYDTGFLSRASNFQLINSGNHFVIRLDRFHGRAGCMIDCFTQDKLFGRVQQSYFVNTRWHILKLCPDDAVRYRVRIDPDP